METETPNSLGYHMPAEWEPHEGTWLIWPHNDTRADSQLHLEHLWLEMTLALHEHESVYIVVTDERRREHLQRQVRYYGLNESNLDIHIIPNDDVWVRDCGPIFLVNESGELSITAWNFNGWGERYPYQKDRFVPTGVAEALSLPLFNASITLEGGALEVNGKGTLIATRSSIINPNRNPGVNQQESEAAIKEYQLINANNRLIIAYTNLASFYSSKAKYTEATEFLSKATSLAASLSKNIDSGLSIYPLIQKAWFLVEQGELKEAKESFNLVLEKTKTFYHSLYQIKVEFGLANIFFLESKDDLALRHAKAAISIVEEIESRDPQYQHHFHLKYASLLIDLNKVDELPGIFETINVNNLKSCSKAYYHYIQGKYEFRIHNISIAKGFIEEAMKYTEDCPDLRSNLLYTQAEIYLNEYRLSEDPQVLQEAQNMITESLEKLKGVPERTKGQCLLAIMLSAQGRIEEAEELLENLTTDSAKSIPRFRILAEKLLDNFHKSRVGTAPLSPITNIRDALRYLRDAKTLINSQSR